MPVIYVDVLLTINLAVDYLLLFATARIAGAEFKRLYGLFGASIGAIYSLIILFALPGIVFTATKLAVSSLIIFLTFNKRTFSEFIKLLLIFYICSFLFSGFMMVLNSAFHADSFFARNGIIYFELSALEIVVSGVGAFFVTEILRRLFHRGEPEGICTIEVIYNQKNTVLKGFTDTGNDLSDPFTGVPVAICKAASLASILPKNMIEAEQNYTLSTKLGMKLIPCRTISGSVLIPAFKPDKFIVNMRGMRYEAEEALIGLSPYAPEDTLILGKNIILKQAGKGFSEVQ